MSAFDESELVLRLGRLPGFARVAFAAACASRMVEPYRQALIEAGVDGPDLLASALSELWQFMFGDLSVTDWMPVADRLVEQIPDEDRMTIPACRVLDDALASTAYAARAAARFDPQEAAWSGRRVYEAAEAFVQRSLDFTSYSPEVERALLNHPIVQRELARQVRDLTELESADFNRHREVFAALRSRAQVERAFD